MRRFILFLLVFFVAVWCGVKIAADPGYALFAYQQWTLEMPLWFAVISVVLIFIFIHYLLRFIRHLGILPKRLRDWVTQRGDRSAIRLTNEGLLALAVGDWRVAEKKLLKADMQNDLGWLNDVAAAQVAHIQNAFERRDNYLQQALRASPKTEVIIGLNQAYFQISQGQFEQAQATLRRLLQLAPRQKYVVVLLIQVYSELEAWDDLIALLLHAQEKKLLLPEQIYQGQRKAYQALLFKTSQQTCHAQILQGIWQQLPRPLQQDAVLVRDYAHYLNANGANDEAEILLRKNLQKNWDKNLVIEYGLVIGVYPDKQLAQAEAWLKNHEKEPELLLTLGRLCIQNQLWGKARSYLEESLAQKPAPETFAELANLFEKINEQQLAYENYKKGLALTNVIVRRPQGRRANPDNCFAIFNRSQ